MNLPLNKLKIIGLKKYVFLVIALAAGLFLIDYLVDRETSVILNTGYVIGLIEIPFFAYLFISILTLAGLFYLFTIVDNRVQKYVIFVSSGLINNLAQRLIFGGVLDYLNFGGLFVFNISDVLIVGGLAVLVLWFVFTKKPLK